MATLATLSLLSLLSLRERVYGSVGAAPGADAAAEAGVFDIAPAGVDVAAVAIVVTAVNVASYGQATQCANAGNICLCRCAQCACNTSCTDIAATNVTSC